METIADRTSIASNATETVTEKKATILEALAERQSRIEISLDNLNGMVASIRSTLLGETDPPQEASIDKPAEVLSVTGNLERLTAEIEQQLKRLEEQIAALQRL